VSAYDKSTFFALMEFFGTLNHYRIFPEISGLDFSCNFSSRYSHSMLYVCDYVWERNLLDSISVLFLKQRSFMQ
jgi:hypothetical protein